MAALRRHSIWSPRRAATLRQISGLLQTACADVEGRLRGQVRAGWRAG